MAQPVDGIKVIQLSPEVEGPPPRDLDAWRGVWVISDPNDKGLSPVAAELLSKARELSELLEVPVSCVIPGTNLSEQAKQAIRYGADRVFLLDHPAMSNFVDQVFGDVIAALARIDRPEIILAPSTPIGRAYIPRVQTILETGLTADCMGLEIEQGSRTLVQTRPTFGGNLMASIVCPEHRPQMATVRPHVLKALEPDETREGELIKVELSQAFFETPVKVLESVTEDLEQEDISQADVIVAVGRGIQDKDTLSLAKRLADVLGGAVGATRPVVDAGWLPDSVQIGQTGVTVSPRLYIGLGISGAIQHTVGIQGSDIIVAVNKDPDAPIFDMVTYGLVGDVKEILPLLLKRLEGKG